VTTLLDGMEAFNDRRAWVMDQEDQLTLLELLYPKSIRTRGKAGAVLHMMNRARWELHKQMKEYRGDG